MGFYASCNDDRHVKSTRASLDGNDLGTIGNYGRLPITTVVDCCSIVLLRVVVGGSKVAVDMARRRGVGRIRNNVVVLGCNRTRPVSGVHHRRRPGVDLFRTGACCGLCVQPQAQQRVFRLRGILKTSSSSVDVTE